MKSTFSLFLLCTFMCGSLAAKGCGGKPADVVFVLDSSASIGKKDFRKQIKFTKNVVDIFDIDKKKTRVGITLFSTDVHPVFGLNTYNDKRAMERAIDKISYKVGGTGTDKALRYIREVEFEENARPKVPKIAILLTDGQSYDRNKTIQEAYLAHASGITIFVIGIGDGVDMTELTAIASHLFHIGNYSALEKIKDTLAIKACKVVYVKPTPSPKLSTIIPIVASDCTLNLMVGVDTNGVGTRHTRNILEFISEVTGALSTEPGNLRTSQLMTECAETPGRMRTKSYAPLIKKMRYQMPKKSRLVKSAGVLIINSAIGDVSKARSEVKRAKFAEFHLIVVNVGHHATKEDISRLLGVESDSEDFFESVFDVSRYGHMTKAQINVTKTLSKYGTCV